MTPSPDEAKGVREGMPNLLARVPEKPGPFQPMDIAPGEYEVVNPDDVHIHVCACGKRFNDAATHQASCKRAVEEAGIETCRPTLLMVQRFIQGRSLDELQWEIRRRLNSLPEPRLNSAEAEKETSKDA